METVITGRFQRYDYPFEFRIFPEGVADKLLDQFRSAFGSLYRNHPDEELLGQIQCGNNVDLGAYVNPDKER